MRLGKKGGGAATLPPAALDGAVPASPFSPSTVLSTGDPPPPALGQQYTNLGIVSATVRSADGNPRVEQAMGLLHFEAAKRNATHVYGLRVELASTAMGQMNTLIYGTAYQVLTEPALVSASVS